MQLKVLGFALLVTLGANMIAQAQDFPPPVSTEEEAPLPPPPPPPSEEDLIAPPPPPGLTTDPLGTLLRRGLHSVFPFREADEAFQAGLNGCQKAILLEGACGDEARVQAACGKEFKFPCHDQMKDMDYGITRPEKQAELANTLKPYMPGITGADAARRAARGRINWSIWSAGNDRFWNYMTAATFGGLDLLKTISSYESQKYRIPAKRNERWEKLGVTNEPCFKQPTAGRADRHGLWLDVRDNSQEGCAGNVDHLENEKLYPGVKIGARGDTVEVGSLYGYATGVIGLRLFPNPDFDAKAKARWNVTKFYEDPNYYNDPKLVRPYRVGMACAFCHVGPNPANPPKDFNNPTWASLNSNPGAQYFWVDRILLWNWNTNKDNFIYQLLHTSRPGALDTSLISSDQINNPRTMNAVYDLPARVILAAKMGHREMLKGGELDNTQFNTVNKMAGNDKLVPNSATMLNSLYDTTPGKESVLAPRVLKDGADSVGPLGALNRVYVNIGLFSDEWVQNFIPLLGGKTVTPFRIAVAEKKSLYWNANVNQTVDTGMFFMAATRPDKLATAPGGAAKINTSDLALGKQAFAVTCARCHSSKLPDEAYSFFNKGSQDKGYCHSGNYLNCWNDYWSYTKTDGFRSKMVALVNQPNFLQDNFLSNDQRVPNNLLDSQLCSPVATNGLQGNIWNDFSSSSYKDMPTIGTFKSAEVSLVSGQTTASDVQVPAGGRGYLRPASLVSIWATAPFLGNNSLGKFDYRGTVDGRLASFNDSIKKLLWPQSRANDLEPGQVRVTYTTGFGSQLPGIVDVTTQKSYLKLPRAYVPKVLYKLLDFYSTVTGSDIVVKGETYASEKDGSYPRSTEKPRRAYGETDDSAAGYSESEMGDYVQLGPIPAGIPVNLITNIDLQSSPLAQGKAIFNLVRGLIDAAKYKDDEAGRKASVQAFMNKAAGPLLKVSKCNDFVVNRGHYFGTEYAPDVVDGSYRAPDGTKRALNDREKNALIEYLKTF